MTNMEKMLIKLEFDKIEKYLVSRKEKLTVDECLQEIGALKMFLTKVTICEVK